MRTKLGTLFFSLFIVLFNISSTANEVEIISDNIKIIENGNIIKSTNSKAIIKKKKLTLQSLVSVYDKKKQEIYLEDDVIFFDKIEDLKIVAPKARYNEKNDILRTIGETRIYYDGKYEILSKNMFYNRKSQEIYSNFETTINDQLGNVYNIEEKFKFDLLNNVISSKKLSVIDDKNNIYYFENSKVDLNNKEIAGRHLKIDFRDDYFGNSKNDPLLKGKSATFTENETKIYKSVFSTCNTENKSCPGWEIETEQFTHDKINKTFNYKNSWLKMFDQEIFYLPFFSHPDPTIKRKSGFLSPTYANSSNYGTWVNIPYFGAIDIDKDFTFKPRIYFDDKFILQSEYRQAFENSNFIADVSYNNDGKNTNSHFFAKNSGVFKNGNTYDFQYQSVTNDEYLKLHNLSNSSDIISNESELKSKFYIENQIDDNTIFTNEFIVYENLSVKDSDRFQYVLPSFDFKKKIETENSYKGNFYVNTYGYQQKYNTNNYQAAITNDFLFNSDNYISKKGMNSNYQFLIKQDSSFTSTPIDDEDDVDLYQSLLIKTEYPLIKKVDGFSDYLKPIVAFKFSPNNSKDISGKNLRLSYDNIFSFNRIRESHNIEEGRSISFGIEYSRDSKNKSNLFTLGLANSISDKKNNNLPSKSKLDQTRSDIVGKLNFNPTNILDIDYNFSYDRDLKHSNYQSITTSLNFDIVETEFNYLSKDNEIGNAESISNTTSLKINEENILKFNTTKNLKTDFTEFYNLKYQYETDCLVASIEFNKEFYEDGSILPDKSLLFYLRYIPFVELRPESTNFK